MEAGATRVAGSSVEGGAVRRCGFSRCHSPLQSNSQPNPSEAPQGISLRKFPLGIRSRGAAAGGYPSVRANPRMTIHLTESRWRVIQRPAGPLSSARVQPSRQLPVAPGEPLKESPGRTGGVPELTGLGHGGREALQNVRETRELWPGERGEPETAADDEVGLARGLALSPDHATPHHVGGEAQRQER